jgi:hypothetical protein
MSLSSINKSLSSKINNIYSSITGNNLKNKLNNGVSTNSNSISDDSSYVIKTDNYVMIMAIAISIIVIGIIYVLSKPFRVNKTLGSLSIYYNYQHLSSLDYSKLGDRKLVNMSVASSYNSSHIGYQMYDYTSEEMILGVLRCGARYIELNVFNSEYGAKATPVVSMGYRQGEWKMCLTDIPFENCIYTIAKNAFTIQDAAQGVPNPDDPIFIGLNLNTNSNMYCLNLVAEILMDYLGSRFIAPRFSYQNTNEIGNITMTELMGRVVIFSSDGYQGSKLEEIVNYSWDNPDGVSKHRMQRITAAKMNESSFNAGNLIAFNKKGLTIVVPHDEGDFWTTNYDPQLAIDYGCQFVAMNYQLIDTNMDRYITMFRNKSIIAKSNKSEKSKKLNK